MTPEKGPLPDKIRAVIVYHSGYGCDTGCCGHRVEFADDKPPYGGFEFEHLDDGEDPIEFAKELVKKNLGEKHVADLDWSQCEIVKYDDCPEYG